MGLVTLNFDLETGKRVASKVGTFFPQLGILGLWVFKLFAMYATDGRTDRERERETRCDRVNSDLGTRVVSGPRRRYRKH